MLIRYPGSKDKHLRFLRPFIDPIASRSRTVVEPFAGTASVTFDLLRRGIADRYVINDIDLGMVSMWNEVKENPERLISAVEAYTPRVEDFYEFKKHAGDTQRERAFRKLVIHQISYSGLGAAAGSPIGGRAQKSAYTVDCRWSPTRLVKAIRECHELLAGHPGSILHGSWTIPVERSLDEGYFIYLDPPYIDRGAKLYRDGVIDHAALADTLRAAGEDQDWLISYDNSAEIDPLYGGWSSIEGVDVRSHLHHKTITDVIIRPKARAHG